MKLRTTYSNHIYIYINTPYCRRYPFSASSFKKTVSIGTALLLLGSLFLVSPFMYICRHIRYVCVHVYVCLCMYVRVCVCKCFIDRFFAQAVRIHGVTILQIVIVFRSVLFEVFWSLHSFDFK